VKGLIPVTRAPIRRLVSLISVGLLAAMALGVGTASAATPGWKFENLKYLPEKVSPNAVAGFSFTIANRGSSNISKLFLTDKFVGVPLYLSTTRGTAVCQTDPELRCAFGALVAGATIDVKIAYRVGTSDFKNTFQLDSTGDPPGGNNSHGDSLPLAVTTTVSSSADFAGTFTLDTTGLANNPVLGRQNKQATSIDPPEANVPVTIEDNVTTTCTATATVCAGAFGEWTKLNVADNKSYLAAGTPFKLTLFVWGGAVPGGTSTGEIQVLHKLDNGTTNVIGDDPSEICSPATGTPDNPECITVTKVGSNWKIEVWLFQNGFLRGGF
jgi:hypothetical protein